MAALTAGTKAPDFDLKTIDGKRFSLQDALRRGPVVLAFFKVSCPVCQYAFPFLERLHRAYGQNGVTLAGISQNDPKDTAAFMKEFYGRLQNGWSKARAVQEGMRELRERSPHPFFWAPFSLIGNIEAS